LSEWGREEVGVEEMLKRILLVGISPFSAFAEIALKPDIAGPFACMILLAFMHLFGNSVIASKVMLATAKGGHLSPPRVTSSGGVLRVVAVNATGHIRRLGELEDEYYLRLHILSLGYSLITWTATSVGIWIALRAVGGSTHLTVVLGGYALSVKLYEIASKAVITAYFLSPYKAIELVLAQPIRNVSVILSLSSAALSAVPGLSTALEAHMAFFTIWSAVVLMAAIQEGGFVSARRALVGAVICYLISSALQLFLYRLFAAFI